MSSAPVFQSPFSSQFSRIMTMEYNEENPATRCFSRAWRRSGDPCDRFRDWLQTYDNVIVRSSQAVMKICSNTTLEPLSGGSLSATSNVADDVDVSVMTDFRTHKGFHEPVSLRSDAELEKMLILENPEDKNSRHDTCSSHPICNATISPNHLHDNEHDPFGSLGHEPSSHYPEATSITPQSLGWWQEVYHQIPCQATSPLPTPHDTSEEDVSRFASIIEHDMISSEDETSPSQPQWFHDADTTYITPTSEYIVSGTNSQSDLTLSLRGSESLLRCHPQVELSNCDRPNGIYNLECDYVGPHPNPPKSNERVMSTRKRDKRFFCVICGQGFGQFSHLRDHIRIHTNEKPFPCSDCPLRFRRKQDLDTHHRQQHAHPLCSKKHKCPVCGRSFKKANALVVHIRTHTGEKPFQCDHCGAVFSQKSNMGRHIALKHPNQV